MKPVNFVEQKRDQRYLSMGICPNYMRLSQERRTRGQQVVARCNCGKCNGRGALDRKNFTLKEFNDNLPQVEVQPGYEHCSQCKGVGLVLEGTGEIPKEYDPSKGPPKDPMAGMFTRRY